MMRFCPHSVQLHLPGNAVVCFTNPTNPEDAPYQVIACSKEVGAFDFTQPYALQIDLDVRQKTIAAKYTRNTFLLSVTSKAVLYYLSKSKRIVA